MRTIEETRSKITNANMDVRNNLENFVNKLKTNKHELDFVSLGTLYCELVNFIIINNYTIFDMSDILNILEMVKRDIPITLSGMSNEAFIKYLESLMHKRFTISDLELAISKFLGFDSGINLSKSVQWDSTNVEDYVLSGSSEDLHIKNIDLPFIDFTIFVLSTKGIKNNEIVYYITEVGYEIQKY